MANQIDSKILKCVFNFPLYDPYGSLHTLCVMIAYHRLKSEISVYNLHERTFIHTNKYL